MIDWYEELEKAEQERDVQEYECYLAYKEGYNKAIDDFVELYNKMTVYKNESGELIPMSVEMMAERLKRGVKNDGSKTNV